MMSVPAQRPTPSDCAYRLVCGPSITTLVVLALVLLAPVARGQTVEISINDVSVAEGDAGSTIASFTIFATTVTGDDDDDDGGDDDDDGGGTVSVDYRTSDGTALAGSDYEATSGSIDFGPGQSAATVAVVVLGDTVVEPDETFSLMLDNARNAIIVDAVGLATIAADDAELSIGDAAVAEGNGGTTGSLRFPVTLRGGGAGVSVDYASSDVTATVADSDYAPVAGTLVFSSGDQTVEVVVAVNGDDKTEGDETLELRLNGASGATLIDDLAIGTLTNDDPVPRIGVDDLLIDEGDGGTSTSAVFTVSLSRPSAFTVSVDYATADGSATAGADYESTAGTVTFSPGETQRSVSVTVLGDDDEEPDETFELRLSAPVNATLNDGVGSAGLRNDDASRPLPGLTIHDATVVEGDSGSLEAVFEVTLDAVSTETVEVELRTQDGTATVADGDYDRLETGLIFPPGTVTLSVPVTVHSDTVHEADESFGVRLFGAANALLVDGDAAGTIGNDDPLPLITVDDLALDEGDAGLTTPASFAVRLSRESAFAITVDFTTADGSAVAGNDYQSTAGTLTFAARETLRSVTVEVLGDDDEEADETFVLQLSNPTGAGFGDASATATLRNDDVRLPALRIADATVREGDAGSVDAVFELTLDSPAVDTVEVRLFTEDGSATMVGVDYEPLDVTLSLPPGTLTLAARVEVHSDTTHEQDETFSVRLQGAVNALLADSVAIGTILNDDPQPRIAIDDLTLDEGDAGATTVAGFTVSLSNPSAFAIAVDYATADGTASAGEDYENDAGRLDFSPGETRRPVQINVLGDDEEEPDETFELRLSAPTNASLADSRGVATVRNDDSPLPALRINDVSVREGDAGSVEAIFEITLDEGSPLPVEVRVTSEDGTATVVDGDYDPLDLQLRFAPGVVSQRARLTVRSDRVFESDETVRLHLSSPVNAELADAEGEATLVNDDPQPGISIDDPMVEEGDTGARPATFTVRLSNPSAFRITVGYATADEAGGDASGRASTGAATAGVDYEPTQGSVEFAPGETEQSFAVSVLGDTEEEPDEAFLVRLHDPVGATIVDGEGRGIIRDDDTSPPPPMLMVADLMLLEGDEGEELVNLVVSLSAPVTETVAIDYTTADGSATAGEDYRATSGSLELLPGATEGTLELFILGDSVPEPDERFFVRLSSPDPFDIGDGEAVVTIRNDDGPQPGLSVADVELDEGDGGERAARFTITLSTASAAPVSVNFATADGTATAAEGDYRPSSGRLELAAGETSAEVEVAVIGDKLVETDETFILRLTDANGAEIADGEATATIRNDDRAPLPALTVADVIVLEGDEGESEARFEVSLAFTVDEEVSFDLRTADETATVDDSDYRPLAGRFSLRPGERSITVAVAVLGDRQVEEDETFLVELDNLLGAELARGRARATIRNDDEPPSRVRIRRAVATGEAAGKIVVEVERFGNLAGRSSVTAVTESLTATAGVDFEAVTVKLAWGDGQGGGRRFAIPLLDDHEEEPREELLIRLTQPSNGTELDAPSELAVAILDDEEPAELRGGGELLATAGGELELEVRVVDSGDRPVSGAAVEWRLEGSGELQSGAVTESDTEGVARQRLRLAPSPGRLVVSASLIGSDSSVRFDIVVEGDLRDLFDGEREPNETSLATVLDTACVAPEGRFAEACEFTFGLASEEERRTLVRELTPDDLAAQGRIAGEAARAQLRNLSARIQELRGGGSGAMPASQLSLSLRGETLGVGQLSSGLKAVRSDQQSLGANFDRAFAELVGTATGATAAPQPPEEPAAEGESRLGVFVNGRLSLGERRPTRLESGYDLRTGGLTAGFDYRLGAQAFLGVALGYLRSDTDLDAGRGGLDAEGLGLSIYSSYYLPHFYVDGVLSYGRNRYDMLRRIDLPQPLAGADRLLADGDTDSDQLSAHLGVGYDASLGRGERKGRGTLSGFGRLSYTDVSIDPFRETGAGPFALELDSQSLDSLLSEAGLELLYPYSFSWGVLQPQLRLSYFHEFRDDARIITGAFVHDITGSRFELSTEEPDRDYLNLGLGLSFTLRRGRAFYLLFDSDLERDDLDLYTLSGGYRQQF